MSRAFASFQRLLPQHLLSRLTGAIAGSESPTIKRLFVTQFAKAYGVSLEEAERQSLDEYASFNDFFTRALEPGARPMPDDAGAIACPADGAVSQLGRIEGDTLLQAKGHQYSLSSLAPGLSTGLENGAFLTVYLAPRDYHRVHLPFGGTLTATRALPGALFSVNASTETAIEGLFCRNERLACRFETDFGPMLVVLVGALIVASIETVWEGPQSPYEREITTQYDTPFGRGAEIGRFLLGSTVICCFPEGAVTLDAALQPGTPVKVGQAIATVTPRV